MFTQRIRHQTIYAWRPFYGIKDLNSCPIEIIKRLNDKEQFQYLTGLMDLPVYNTISFTKININILSENT